MKETTVQLVTKEMFAFMKDDKGFADHIVGILSRELADRLIQILNDEIEDLPSAQPEIIRCKECKYWFDIDDGRQKHRMCADFFGEWFCADAERRTDERTD